MTKYSYELKKEIVMAYINGEGGKQYLAKKYEVKSPKDIMKWVKHIKTLVMRVLRSSNN